MPFFESFSFGSDKSAAVIFDFGHAYTKIGFAGEVSPQTILPSKVYRQSLKRMVNVFDVKDPVELYDTLIDFIHVLYFRHLLVNPKGRRVLIVESIFTPSYIRNAIAKALFMHFEVSSILFAPGHLLSLFTLGTQTGLVLDTGYDEAIVLPVYEGVPILKAWQALPLGAKAIHKYLETSLLETGNVKSQEQELKPLSTVQDHVEESVLEDIKIRCCFVTCMDRAEKYRASEISKEVESPSIPPSVDYPLDGSTILLIDGKIREQTCELFFERDNEEKSLATLLLDAILQCPRDVRRSLAENIVITGGSSMLTGFNSRLSSELYSLLNSKLYKDKISLKTFKFHQPPCKENYTAWLGGSIFGSSETLSSRSILRDSYLNDNTLPDWSVVRDRAGGKEEKIKLSVLKMITS